MPFVTKTGSKQYIVDEGQRFAVDYINNVKEGDVIELPVLFTFGGSKSSNSLSAKVVGHEKGEKIRVVKYKSKSNYHRQYGFRAQQTVLEVVGGGTAKKAPAKKTSSDETKASAKNSSKKETTKPATKKTVSKATPKKTTAKAKKAEK
jgi:large subunit ribosomal protein L21